MPWRNLALELAGLIGAVVAIAHGVLVHRLIVKPLADNGAFASTLSSVVRRLIPPLLQFSTVIWLAGGVALMCTPLLDTQARLSVAVLVGGSYLFGVIGNFWATRGRHPGWMLLALALGLIAFGANARSLITLSTL